MFGKLRVEIGLVLCFDDLMSGSRTLLVTISIVQTLASIQFSPQTADMTATARIDFVFHLVHLLQQAEW